MIEALDIPDSAYENARKRYEDIGEWFGREGGLCASYEPHIFPQGSFRLGTAIRPLDQSEEYDLDLACKLRKGVTKQSCTQEYLKTLIGKELESYRLARGIKAPKESRHRCWRLYYQDHLCFHMDIVPCIPEEVTKQVMIKEAMKLAGVDGTLASNISLNLVSITDDRHERYRQICDDWLVSNPIGYADWFESRMNQTLSKKRLFAEAQVDDVPLYKRKTPLQRVVQLLKRHRDQMFKSKENKDAKPISVIITTLAAKAYKGETNVESAMVRILSEMAHYVNSQKPRIPNPVYPAEDFADRWAMPQYRHLQLEQNFWAWLTQAQTDFELLGASDDVSFISDQIMQKFSLNVEKSILNEKLFSGAGPASVYTPKKHPINNTPANPWMET